MLDVQFLDVSITKTSSPCPIVEVDHVPIHQHGYGRLDSSSSCAGLCTSVLAACIAIIVHCPATSRTTLSHSPNYLIIPIEFSPIFTWVLNGERSTKIDVVIIRGALYNDTTNKMFGHDGFVQDFRDFSSNFLRGVNIEVVDYPTICSNGSILVDKTATISIVKSSFKGYVVLRNPTLFAIHGDTQALHMIMCLQLERCDLGGEVSNSIRLQYDLNHYVNSFKFSDSARELLRSIRTEEKGWQINPKYEKYTSIRNDVALITNIINNKQCEYCVNKGDKTCSRCHGAWYCSVDCQKKDYANHKKWCKSHIIAI